MAAIFSQQRSAGNAVFWFQSTGAVTHVATGSLSAGLSVISGAATQHRLHAASGNLIASTATLSGVAVISIGGVIYWPLPSEVLAGVSYGPTGAEYTGTATGGTGPSAESIAAAVIAALNATTIPVNTVKMNGSLIYGDGSTDNKWRGNV